MIQKEHVETEYECEYCHKTGYNKQGTVRHEKFCPSNPDVKRFIDEAVGQWFRRASGEIIYVAEFDEEYLNLAGYRMHDASGGDMPYVAMASWSIESVMEFSTKLAPAEGRMYFETVIADLWTVVQ